MVLKVKNMVCDRCVKVVKSELEGIGLSVSSIKLGEVVLQQQEGDVDLVKVKSLLEENGFELLDDRKKILIENIKAFIINSIRTHNDAHLHTNFSHLLEQEVGRDYQYLSTLFSSTEGLTIEKYMILQRIEKVKELLVYDELNLNEIAFQLGYSSAQHLSAQFKKVAGLTPSEFKRLSDPPRKPLDHIPAS